MTQDEIIEMARQAGFNHGLDDPIIYAAHERFAKLVAAKEREECGDAALKAAESSIVLAMKLEREACAKLAENRGLMGASKKEASAYQFACKSIAEGIRARGQA